VAVPPQENAVPWEADHPRTQALADIAARGLPEWKKSIGYHRRSLAGTGLLSFLGTTYSALLCKATQYVVYF